MQTITTQRPAPVVLSGNAVHKTTGAGRWVVIVCIYIFSAIYSVSWGISVTGIKTAHQKHQDPHYDTTVDNTASAPPFIGINSFLASGVSALVIFAVTIPGLIYADKWGRRSSIVFEIAVEHTIEFPLVTVSYFAVREGLRRT
jgi:hypothetical protein